MPRLIAILLFPSLFAAAQYKAVNPDVKRVVDAVSEERIAATMKKLESFGTRNTLSEADSPTRGIGAARQWIFDELKSYSPRLQVSFDTYKVKKHGRITRDVELRNVVAVLPGTNQKERHILISGHYDSLNIVRKKNEKGEDVMDNEASAASPFAPGVSDDASGTAVAMELARVISRYEFEKTLVFVAFVAEEQGLVGATLYAGKAKEAKTIIDAVLNNDIVGNELGGSGRHADSTVNVYSDDPGDSPSRAIARYAKEMGERYVPSMRVNTVFRADRFARGGDHTPFANEGFGAVRFTTPAEFFANQHTASDTFANSSPAYAARVARVNAAVAASLAWAPKAPVVLRQNPSTVAVNNPLAPDLGRGKSGYGALLRWKHDAEPDLLGFVVVVRNTTAPFWEREIFVGDVREYTLPDVNIDEIVLGIKAVDKASNESPVAAYAYPAPLRKNATWELAP